MQKNLKLLITIILIIALPIVIIYESIAFYAFDRTYFEKEFSKYNIAENVGIGKDTLSNINDMTLNYLNGRVDDLDYVVTINGDTREFFSEQDKLHMIDVKNIFIIFKLLDRISIIAIILCLIVIFKKEKQAIKLISRQIIMSGAAIIAAFLGLIILMKIDFYKYFTIFHEIFFTNDLWLMDPERDMLVNIYPEQFFVNIALNIAISIIGIYLILIIASKAYLIIKKWKEQKND